MTIQAHVDTNGEAGDAPSSANSYGILETARRQVLDEGIGLTRAQLEDVLRLPDEALPAALELAHEVRLKHCGEDVEVEGIISIKTGAAPRTATSAASPACSTPPSAASGSISRNWSRQPRKPPPPEPRSSASSPRSAAPTSNS
ncbi:biotin synthase [Arthrobacter sp. Hiyo6]|nr:biotin synthase [Arthrobacter sp. Hiyo6]